MKKGKIIAVGIASFGVVASVGAAIALYTKAANEVKFGFGKFDYHPSTETLNYYLGDAVEAEDVVTNTTITKKYSIPMSAVYPTALNTKVIAQDFRAGNISVSFSGGDAIKTHTAVTAVVKGYDAESYLSDGVTVIDNVTYTSDAVSGNADVTVDAGDDTPTIAEGAQYLEVTLVFTGTYLDFDEASLRLDVTWAAPSASYLPAYIKGDANEWTAVDEYEMVENINASSKEWTFKNLTGFTVMKIYRDTTPEATWVGDKGGADVSIDKDKTYQVYWHESEGDVTPHEYNSVNYISHVD